VPTFKKAMLFPDEIAVKDVAGEFTFFQLFITAKKLAIQISNFCGKRYITVKSPVHASDQSSACCLLF